MPRIFALVRDAIARGETVEQARTLSSDSYTLGTGHCRFFYTRLGWLTERYLLLVREMLDRGYNPSFLQPPDWTRDIPAAWFGHWQPTPVCVQTNVERINTRLCGMGLPWMQLGLIDGQYCHLGHDGIAMARGLG